MASNRQLFNEYRATWEEFSRQLDELQQFVESGARDCIDGALLNVEKARLAHNEARDRLAAHMTGEIKAADQPVTNAVTEEERVRTTARLLWEFSGKPHGTAENDWFRAQRLVRSARAASAGGGTEAL
ncbi:MAG: DUF2934 domain-containing protein [Bryobacteraceae bacterium]|jgi:hypothetical protein